MKDLMYRGVRTHDPSLFKINGMKYYWETTTDAVIDVVRVLADHDKLSCLDNKDYMIKSVIDEASNINRIQLWGANNYNLAASYSYDTPELIFIMLKHFDIEPSHIRKYLDKKYGLPHVVTFIKPEYAYHGINEQLGDFIPPEDIISVDMVDTTLPDPLYGNAFNRISNEVIIK